MFTTNGVIKKTGIDKQGKLVLINDRKNYKMKEEIDKRS